MKASAEPMGRTKTPRRDPTAVNSDRGDEPHVNGARNNRNSTSSEVFDSNGSLIDSIAEQRTMDSDAEACGVLQYGWPEGRLTRLNERAMTRSALLKASVSHRLGMIV
eukprot:gene27567-49199_t